MTVTVSAAHVAAGLPGQCTLCPVARALEVATGFPWWVLEDRARPLVGPPDDYTPLPPEVTDWVRAFDRGAALDPPTFEFDYAVPVTTP